MRLWIAAFLVFAASTARAGGIGVVVTGDPVMGVRVASHLEAWLSKHGHEIVSSPLPSDAINTILNCIIADDQKCMRDVVDARSRSKSLVFATVQPADKKSKDVTFTAFWFVKGHEPISERRVCENCTEDAWQGLADTMMAALSGSSRTEVGRLVLASDPSGLIVMLDNVQVGVTPLESDLPAGDHTIKLAHAGRTVAKKRIAIEGGETTTVRMHADVEVGRSRALPTILIVGGAGCAGAAAYFLYQGSLSGPTQKYQYPTATPVGLLFAALAAGGMISGGVMLFQKSSPAPVVALTPGGAYVGWATQF